MELKVKTIKKSQVIDITEEVQQLADRQAKAVNIFCLHTTCALTTADLDPGTDEDLLDAIEKIIPALKYRHPHNPNHEHVYSHLASSLIGPSITVPLKHGKLALGSWQRLILVELDGPRRRDLIITNL
jgi:secondary thiamine-phosphate synthase enzyme